MKKAHGTIIASMVGFSAGMATGLLLSPKSGKELRSWISSQTKGTKNWVEERSTKILNNAEYQLSKISEKIKSAVPNLYEATEVIHFEEEDLDTDA